MAAPTVHDALVIGGGPAGISSALTMARALQKVVVFDSGVYRNQRATHMHTLPTWDHKNPADFRRTARAEILSRYKTVSFHDSALTHVKKTESGTFEATSADGRQWLGRVIILATGVRDVLPDIDGYDECWVRGIFHCLFCHGYEERGVASAGVLAIGDLAEIPPALHLARAAKQLAGKVTIYTDGFDALADSLTAALRPDERKHIVTDTRPITILVKEKEGTDVTIHFASGSASREGFLVHRPKTELNGPFAQQLGLQLTPQGDIFTSAPFGETSMPGVYAVGDCGSPGKIVANAISTGAFAGAGATAKLQAKAF
ncbi:hypothetical protein M434DRAFT_324807 [Hypoxylon sp. CO27-5]|nr:hypothetical protein M434DRAFT_324807 [Hypoxylon sp. CO27-5]